MRFIGAAVGFVTGTLLVPLVAPVLAHFFFTGFEEDLAAFAVAILVCPLSGSIIGWIIAGRIQDRDGDGLRDHRRPRNEWRDSLDS